MRRLTRDAPCSPRSCQPEPARLRARYPFRLEEHVSHHRGNGSIAIADVSCVLTMELGNHRRLVNGAPVLRQLGPQGREPVDAAVAADLREAIQCVRGPQPLALGVTLLAALGCDD